MLQRLLNVGLVDIGSDDSRFQKLEESVNEVASLLAASPAMFVPATLTALDADVDEDEPMLELVEKSIIARWNTLKNTHTNRPRSLLRAVIISALAKAAAQRVDVAGVIWLTASSPLRHGQSKFGKESEAVLEMMQGLGEQFEVEALSRAGLLTPDVDQASSFAAEDEDKLGKAPSKVTENELEQDVARAAGPQYNNANLPGANPQWPSTGQPWSAQFVPLMTAALAKSANLAVGHTLDALVPLRTRLEKVVKKTSADAATTSRLLVDVLWWAQAKYSPSLKKGYRELHAESAALMMAQDLAEMVSPVSPASVSYLLGETVSDLELPSARHEKRPLDDILKGLAQNAGEAKVLWDSSERSSGRQPLLSALPLVLSGRALSKKELRHQFGLRADAKLSIGEFSMWLYRDFQARRLLKEIR